MTFWSSNYASSCCKLEASMIDNIKVVSGDNYDDK